METTNKTLLNVEINSSQAIKNVTELKKEVEGLRAKQKDLDRSTDEGRQQYEIYNQQIKALNTTTREYEKQIQSNVKAQNEQEGSLQGLKAQLSLTTAEYNKLSKEQRNSAAGVEMKNSIKGISDELKEAEGSVGNFSRNVGDYENKIKSALGLNKGFTGSLSEMATGAGGVSGGLKTAGSSVKAFGTQLLTLLANPVVLMIAGIAAGVMLLYTAFKKAYDVIKSNEEQSNRLTAAMAPLKALADATTRVFEKLGDVLLVVAEGISNVISWMVDLVGAGDEVNANSETYIKLEKDKAQLIKDTRKNLEDASKTELEIAELRNQIAQKDVYDAQQRIEFVDQAIAKELELGENKKRIAMQNLANLELEGTMTKNSAEFEQQLANARIAVNNATAEAINSTKRLVAARATAITEIQSENKAAEAQAKAAADKRIAIAKSIREAENQLRNLMVAAELDALMKVSDNIKKTDTERISAIKEFREKELRLLEENTAFEISNNNLKGAALQVAEEKLSQAKIALTDKTNKAIDDIQNASDRKKLDDQIALLEFEAEFAKEKLEEQLAGKIRTDEEKHLSELLRIERDTQAKKAELELRLSAEPEKEAEIKRAISIVEQKAKTATAKQNADFYKQQQDLKIAGQKANYANELELARNNIDKEHQLLLQGLEADRLAEIAAAEKTGADVALINKKYAQLEKDLSDETRARKVENIEKFASAVADGLSSLNDLMNALGERELQDAEKKNIAKKTDLDKQLKAGLISQQEHDYQVALSAYELDKKKDKLEREAAIRAKALALVMAVINTASAIVAALATPLIGPGLAIAAGIAGAFQIAAIAATPLPTGSVGAIPQFSDFAASASGGASNNGKAEEAARKESERVQKELEKAAETAQKLSDKAQSEYEKAIEKAEKAIQDAQTLKDKIAQEERDRADKAIMDAWDKSDRAIAEASKRADDISVQAQKALADALSNFEKAQQAVISIQEKIDKKAFDKLTAEERARVQLLEDAEKEIFDALKSADKQVEDAQKSADKAIEIAQQKELAYLELLQQAKYSGRTAAELQQTADLAKGNLSGQLSALWYNPEAKAALRKQAEDAQKAADKALADAEKQADKLEKTRIDAENARIAAEQAQIVVDNARIAQDSASEAAKQATFAAEERAKIAAEAAQRASDAEDLAWQRELEAAKQAEIDAQAALEQSKLDAEVAKQDAEVAAEKKLAAELAAEERRRSYDEAMEERRRIANEIAQEKADKAAHEAQEAANNASKAAAQASEAAAMAASAAGWTVTGTIPTKDGKPLIIIPKNEPIITPKKDLTFNPTTYTFSNDGGYQSRNSQDNGSITKEEMKEAMKEAVAEVKIYATIEDIRKEDKNYTIIESRGKYLL